VNSIKDMNDLRKLAQTYNLKDEVQRLAFLFQLALSGVPKKFILQLQNELKEV